MKKILILLFFGSVKFCQAETRSLLTPDKSSGQGFFKNMEEINKDAMAKKVSGIFDKIFITAIGVALYYAYRGTRNGVCATTNFFFPERV
jgi:hypothetical protein